MKGNISFWNLDNYEKLFLDYEKNVYLKIYKIFYHESKVTSIDSTADGKYIATCSEDNKIIIWEVSY